MNSNKKVLHARRDFNTKTSTIASVLNSSLRSTSKLDLSFTRTLSSDSRKPPNLPRSAKNSRPPVPPLKSRNIPKQIPDDLRSREFDMFSYQEFRKAEIKLSRKISSACFPFMFDEEFESMPIRPTEITWTLSALQAKPYNFEEFKRWHELCRQEVWNRKETGM